MDNLDQFIRTISILSVVEKILITLIAIIILNILGYIVTSFKNFIYRKISQLSISGYWLVDFISEDKHVIEIYRLSESYNNWNEEVKMIKFNYQHYKREGTLNVVKGAGVGIFKSRNVSLSYHSIEKDIRVVGGIVLSIQDISTGVTMVGNFYECFNNRIRSSTSEKIIFRRMNLSIWKRLKFKYRFKAFKSYNEILEYFGKDQMKALKV